VFHKFLRRQMEDNIHLRNNLSYLEEAHSYLLRRHIFYKDEAV
jgi:hypothetical protein